MSINEALNTTLQAIVSIFFVESTNSLIINFPRNTPIESIEEFSRYFHLSLRRSGKKRFYFSNSIFLMAGNISTAGQLVLKISSMRGKITPIHNSGIPIRETDIVRLSIARKNAVEFRRKKTRFAKFAIMEKDSLGEGIDFALQQ